MKKILYPATIAALTLSAMSAQAVVIANWTFETSIPLTAGPFTPEVGAGSALGVHAGAATYSSPAGNGSSHSFSSNTWAIGDYYQFSVSTLGLSNISLTFDQTSSNTGPRDFGVFYSTNGVSFTQFGADYQVLPNAAPNPTWNATTSSPIYTFSYDLSSVASLNNAATVTFRLQNTTTVAANGTTVAATGTDRVDNVIIQTQAVPEPASMAVLGLGVVALIRRRRSK
jgi:hypothetical protein